MPDIEVVISDDASPDNTAEVVEEYKVKLPNIKFIRQAVNIGLDRNFLSVVENASADYVWLMGDDDKLEPGGLAKVLAALANWPGVGGMTIGVIDYDSSFRFPVGLKQMPPTERLRGTEAVFGKLAHLLGFMSTLVVDRRKWALVCREDPVLKYENYYVQVYIIGRIVDRFGDWGILSAPCVGFRTSNDQFLSKFGWLKRLKIDVVAYDQIARALFTQNPRARNAMRARIFDTHIMARIRNAKTSNEPTAGVFDAFTFLYGHYKGFPKFWLSALPTLVAPKWMIRNVRFAYQAYSSRSGAARARALTSTHSSGQS
jgi:glycosyltransferase involved in cell wall biosynthesis